MTTERASRSAARSAAYWSNLIALGAVVVSLSTTVLGAIITVSVSVSKIDAIGARLEDVDRNGTQSEKETRFIVNQHSREIVELRDNTREILGAAQEVRSKVDVMGTKLDLIIERQIPRNGNPADVRAAPAEGKAAADHSGSGENSRI